MTHTPIKNALHTPLALSRRRADVIENAFGVEILTTTSVDHALPLIRAANHHDGLVRALRACMEGLAGYAGFDNLDEARRKPWFLAAYAEQLAALDAAEGRANG